MKRLVFLSAVVILVGGTTILAQQRGGSGGNRAGNNQTRNVSSSDRMMRRQQRRDRISQRGTTDTVNRPDIQRRKPKKIGKLLRGLNLSKRQKHKVGQILKEAKQNGTPKKQVLREINSVLNPRQSKKFKKKIKRIYSNKNGDGGGTDQNPPMLDTTSDTP